jgi:serine/threonine protein kinase/Tol biopolymer transport system component
VIRLQAGARLGPYEIITLLGAGGMGRVYRARDTRLGRDVALKVLPPELAADPERRQRFEHEARTAGALNHPNIVAVYDLGNDNGISYIVTEIVEGEPLRARIDNGKLTTREVLDYAAQMSDALSAAHAAGIVHRDLKPENVMITVRGRVKLLDFGLARHFELPRAVSSTITAIATRPGMILGTVAYMSPEQVKGLPADHRSDIFSFGSVVFEMLSGYRPFAGETSVETLTAIMKQEARRLPETAPPGLTRIVDRCLEKNPEQRFQSARDLGFVLRSVTTTTSGEAPAAAAVQQPPAPKPGWFRIALPWLACVIFATAFVLALLAPPGADISSLTFRPIASSEEPEFRGVWSPDGRSIAYVSMVGLSEQVMVKGLEATAPVQLTQLPAGPGASSPNWSLDGRRVYFLWRRTVWSVARAGGDPQMLFAPSGEAPSMLAAALSPDGNVLAVWRSTRVGEEIRSSVWLSSPPGAPLKKYEPAPFEVTGTFGPVFLGWAPDGRKLMASFYRTEGPQMWLLPFPDGERAEPHRVFAELVGGGSPSFSWFPDSRHVVLSLVDGVHTRGRLWAADTVSEKARPLTAGDSREYLPAVAPDGKRILYTSGAVDYDLMQVPLDGGQPQPLVGTRRFEAWPSWSPVAPEFAYVTDVGGEQEIRVYNTETHRNHVSVSRANFPNLPVSGFQSPVFSPDSSQIAFAARTSTNLSSIWISPTNGGVPARLTGESVFAQTPAWAPDGKWIAHQELRNGRISLVKTRVGSNQPGETILARSCEEAPSWSPTGDWIICAGPDGPAIVSPDGKQERRLGKRYLSAAVWSKDGSSLYVAFIEGGTIRLANLDWRTGEQRLLVDWPRQYAVAAPVAGTANVSLSPDGRSLAMTTVRFDTDLWLLEGFEPPSGFFDWLPWRGTHTLR